MRKNGIPVLKVSSPKLLSFISHKEWKNMCDNAIKIWHFEKTKRGVKPVKGEYDPTNPNHVKISDVITIV